MSHKRFIINFTIGEISLRCLTGKRASKAQESGIAIIDDAINLSQKLETITSNDKEELELIKKDLKKLEKKMKEKQDELPFTIKQELDPMLIELRGHISGMVGGVGIEDLINTNDDND